MPKKLNRILIFIPSILLIISLTFAMVWGVRWIKTYEEYADVDYEWNDDFDRYEVFIDGLGRFYMPTDKATLIFLPDDETLNVAVIEKEETIFHKFEQYSLKKFYLNIGWRGEL